MLSVEADTLSINIFIMTHRYSALSMQPFWAKMLLQSVYIPTIRPARYRFRFPFGVSGAVPSGLSAMSQSVTRAPPPGGLSPLFTLDRPTGFTRGGSSLPRRQQPRRLPRRQHAAMPRVFLSRMAGSKLLARVARETAICAMCFAPSRAPC